MRTVFGNGTRRARLQLALAASLALPSAVAATTMAALPAAAATAVKADVAMRILVLDDGAPMVGAIADRLTVEGVPFTRLDITAAGRADITAAYLVKTDTAGAHGQFAGIVAPSEAPSQLSDAERTVLHEYEQTFKVREVDAYTWAHPEVGLNYAGYVGAVDGMTATVATEGLTGPFSYLKGSFALDDISPSVSESWGYLATPATVTDGSTFTPLVTAKIPATGEQGSLVGVYAKDGREQLVVTFAENSSQTHFRTLGHGIVTWLTRGVSMSMNRNYLSVHVDDVLLGDSRWNSSANCTDDECATPGNLTDIRMTATDVTRLVAFQTKTGIKLDMVFNGDGTGQNTPAGGTDALTTALMAKKSSLRWINHTWSHPYLGCVQDFTTTPWSCAKTATGATNWQTASFISTEISKNKQYATGKSLPNYSSSELVTGEHSGLKTLPQMPSDNPNLATALTGNGIAWVASDASRETTVRKIGSAITVPRHPMNIYYNTGTKAEAVDEYNYIYTSKANGGSGACETMSDIMTCIDPLNATTGFDDYIVPIESRIATSHVLNNDAMPHYAHQSNLAEDGVLYPVLDKLVTDYKATFATNTPLVNPTMSAAGTEMVNQQNWKSVQSSVTGVISGTSVTLRNTSSKALNVPFTAPAGTKELFLGYFPLSFGSSYAGQASSWSTLFGGTSMKLTLPAATGFATTVTWPVAPDAPAGTPDPTVQAATTTQSVSLNTASKLTQTIVGG